jgi:signal transduction histidine kinase
MEIQYFSIQTQASVVAALAYAIIFLVLLISGLLLFFHYSRRKIIQKEVEKVNLKLEYQRQILRATISTQEEERKRIAQDLHDDISSKLNVVSLTANMLLENEDLSKEQITAVEHILDVTTNTIESSRKIAHDLLPPILDKFGLKVALEELFDDFIKGSHLQILHEIETIPELTQNKELHLFRIVQELLNNAVKHGQATQMSIDLLHKPLGFELSCKDNGTGFSLDVLHKKSGIGLQNIKSRAAILESSLHIDSSPDKGSKFTIISPRHE